MVIQQDSARLESSSESQASFTISSSSQTHIRSASETRLHLIAPLSVDQPLHNPRSQGNDMEQSSSRPNSANTGTPLDANPFRAQINTIEKLINPQFPSWALAILILFAITRGILILICAAIMVIPLCKGPESRKKHWFLFRRIPQLGTVWRGCSFFEAVIMFKHPY
ncbi:uncharacterized protein MELLADRAFT_114164 [Melampsora larici-populina 98AG31]|uniref:Uncharacterized protein n=1 Tax=Melampsora larici-populina (strain 98AG31 / pathotype 3-4-7) TaxID=747676 RepID=F4SCG3_MELLP|nr:uncharacterized protein MELLADRAFT_114164 [Melampsora larici-populina 98AG31]EGF97667.1 hypothetical protein MELLADRAFT_114164 [Melampsora larici-populina 98AG31]